MQGITPGQWDRLFRGLTSNSHVESLSAANCDLCDANADAIAACLEGNATMRAVTLDSNRLSAGAVLRFG